MFFNASAPGYRIWAAVVACAAVVAVVATTTIRQGAAQIDPGTEVLSVDGDEIRALSYQTGTMTLTARRSAGMDRFVVDMVFSDGRTARHCELSRDLGGVLPELTRIVARRQLTRQQAVTDFPVQLGTLVLEDQIPSEPIEPIIVRAAPDKSKIAMVLKDVTVETTAAPTVFAKLEEGCAALGAK